MSEHSLTITTLGARSWRVDLDGADSCEVSVPEGYLEKLGLAAIPPERILEESFRFLLEREPASAILRRFELPVIARYFPEYEREIKRRLA